jgi:hypothetical protein
MEKEKELLNENKTKFPELKLFSIDFQRKMSAGWLLVKGGGSKVNCSPMEKLPFDRQGDA